MTEKIKQTLKDYASMRWTVLFMVSMLMFGTYWFQDFFSGLKPLMESQLGITSTGFSTMIGLTSIATMFGMVVIGGMILDKWGIRLTVLVFGTVATLGGVISALGANDVFSSDPSTRLLIMTIGRIIFGVGLETTCVIITRTVVKWFKGYELALALSINMGIGRLGSAIGIAISPDIGGGKVPAAVTLAATLIGVGFLIYIIYLIVDVKLDKQLAKTSKVNIEEEEEEDFRFADLKKLLTNKAFWFIALLCVAFYSAVFPFMQYAPDLLINEFGFSFKTVQTNTLTNILIFIGLFIFGLAFPLLPTNIKNKKGKIASVIITGILFAGYIYLFRNTFAIFVKNGPKAAAFLPMGTILFTPIFGRFVDRKGKAASVMLLGSALLIFSHFVFAFLHSLLLCYISLFSLGIAFSLVPAAMWPSVAKIVPERRLGTAYATMFTVQNWGLFTFNKGIGTVLDWTNPKIVNQIQGLRENLLAQGMSKFEVSQRIQHLRNIGEIPPYDYTVPISLFIICGVVSIFLALKLRKTSKEKNIGLEKPFE